MTREHRDPRRTAKETYRVEGATAARADSSGGDRRREGGGEMVVMSCGYAASLMSIETLIELRKKPTGREGGHHHKGGVGRDGRREEGGGDGGRGFEAMPHVS